MCELVERFYSDHEFAAYLRREGAINNYAHFGDRVRWNRSDGSLAAVAEFNNANCTRKIYLPVKKRAS